MKKRKKRTKKADVPLEVKIIQNTKEVFEYECSDAITINCKAAFWGNRVGISEEWKDRKAELNRMLMKVRGNNPSKDDRFRVEVWLRPRPDVDAVNKFFMDSMEGVVYVKDRQVWKQTGERDINRRNYLIKVTII